MRRLLLFTLFILLIHFRAFSQTDYVHKKFKILSIKESTDKPFSPKPLPQIITALDIDNKDTCNIISLRDTLQSHEGYSMLIIGKEYDLFVRDIFKNMPISPTPIIIRMGPDSYINSDELRTQSYFDKGIFGLYIRQ